MPNTPYLGIPQVSASQNQKEVTINDAILALEAATNAVLTVDYTGVTTYTLTATQATRNMIFKLTNASSASILNFPIAINGASLNRTFVVRNESGQAQTIKFASGAGSTVVVPNGAARLIAALDGTNMIVAAEPATVVDFLSLTDTPGTYAGMGGKVIAVNEDEDELEFIEVVSFPSFSGNALKGLRVKADGTGVEWATIVTTFVALTDTPATYAGQQGKLVAVKTAENGLEFVDPPEAEAVEYLPSARWRILVVDGGTETQIGFGEVEFQNADGINQATGGTATASSYDTGKEPFLAFDNNTGPGEGWLSEPSDVVDSWIEYEFASPVSIRFVKLWPINSFPQFTPTQFKIQRWNGSEFVDAGERIPLEWVSEEPQTFKVTGVPLSSVTDAPDDGKTYARKNEAWIEIGRVSINSYTDDHTLGLADVGGYVRIAKATPVDCTVPPQSDVAWQVGDLINVRAADAGQVTIVAGSGVTITTAETLKLRKQNSSAALIYQGSDVWDLAGDLEAA